LKAELLELRKACDRHHLILYIDGARLAMALTAPGNDVALEDLPKIADAFYIGGTKCGALFGEALILVNDSLKPDFRFLLKQRGGLMAKSRLMGIQFQALMTDDLIFRLGAHSNQMASLLAAGIKKAGYRFAVEPATNLIFPIFPNTLIEKLQKSVMFEGWRPYPDGTSAIRLVTSWGSTEEEVREFLSLI
jgi:threonine aldolase